MRALLILLPLVISAQDPVPIFGTTVVIPSGLKGDLYFLPPQTMSLPDFSKLQPEGTIYTTALNVPPQHFTFGFPGVTDRVEWFAINYTGRFWVEKPGIYRFRLISDDGSRLYLDGQLIADNDLHHPATARVASLRLAGGLHTIRVPWFQGPRDGVALTLEIAGPGEQPRIFSTDEFKPPADPEKWHYAAPPLDAITDPDLSREVPETIPAPNDSKSGKKRKR